MMENERRKQLGITLTSDTIERLEIICDELGLAKSHAISMMINKYWIENMAEFEGKQRVNNQKGVGAIEKKA